MSETYLATLRADTNGVQGDYTGESYRQELQENAARSVIDDSEMAVILVDSDVVEEQVQFYEWDKLIPFIDSKALVKLTKCLFAVDNIRLCTVEGIAPMFDEEAMGAPVLPVVGVQVKFAGVENIVLLNCVDKTARYYVMDE